MWLNDLLPEQPESPAEAARPSLEEPPKRIPTPVDAVAANNDPARQAKPGACRQRLASPSQAGAIDWETLAAWKDEFPHLRPCPKVKNSSGDWLWANRSQCQGCPWAVTEETRMLQ